MIIKNEIDLFENYLSDASGYKGIADVLFIPEDKTELQNLINQLYQQNIEITIAGAGTGLTGSRTPSSGAIISLEKFNKIINFDLDNQIIEAEVGITWRDLNNFLEEKGYYLPPNPTEYNSSLGGNIAHNSSGSRTYKYGAIRNYVQEIELILFNGENLIINRDDSEYLSHTSSNSLSSGSTNSLSKNYKIEFQLKENKYTLPTKNIKSPNTKNASGYFLKENMHLIDLFIGSEGTLGAITKVKLKVEKLPNNLIGIVVYFEDYNNLLNFVEVVKVTNHKSSNQKYTNFISSNLNQNLLDTRLIEYFDTNALKVISEKFNLPENAKYAIWLEQEVEESELIDEILAQWYELISNFTKLKDDTWIALNENEHNQMREFRHYLPLQIYENLAKNNQLKIGTDAAVEDKYFREYFDFIMEKLSKLDVFHIVFGHIGNNHLHINLFCNTEQQKEKALKFYDDLILETIRLNGTVSAEHGIGKLKKKYFKMMYDNETIELMKSIKLTFDPKNLINKGNIFDID